MENIFIEFLPPWVETGLQPAFYDKESGTVLQQVSRMYPKINELIKSNNKISGEFTVLYNYVHDYLDNLDVQQEINNKLDEMAEQGELAGIIAQFLEMAPVFGYNTISDMAAADNLSNGCIAKVLGKTNANTGDGSFYRIRTRTGADTPDGLNLVAITGDNTIIAQIIPDAPLNSLASRVTQAEADIDDIQDTISKKTMIVIGDSYSTTTQSGSPLWYEYIAKWDNLNVYAHPGDGQGYVTGPNNFLVQLQNAYDHVDQDLVDRIYVLGGLNDIGNLSVSVDGFKAGVVNTFDYIRSHFPNAKVYIIGIMPFQKYNWYSVREDMPMFRADHLNAWLAYYCGNYNFIFRSSSTFGLNIPDFFGSTNASGQKHPTARGEKLIANFIYNGNRIFAAENVECAMKGMEIPSDNGTVTVYSVFAHNICLTITNYNNTQPINISGLNLPNQFNFLPVSDEAGHTNFLYRAVDGNIKMNANSGLNSGTLYVTVPLDFTI